jgi:hypothetical protein
MRTALHFDERGIYGLDWTTLDLVAVLVIVESCRQVDWLTG